MKIKVENFSKALHVFNILKVNFSCKYKKRLDKRCIKRRVNKFEPQWYIFFNVQMYHTRNGCMHGLQNMICPPLYLHNLMGKWILCNLFQFHYMRDKETLLFSSSNPSDANWNVYYALNYFFFFDRQIKLKLQKWYNSQIEAMIKQSIDFKFWVAIKVLCITLNNIKCLFNIDYTLRPDVGSLVGIKCIYQMGNKRDIFVLIGISWYI